ncbi:hypothetical protein EIN_048200 [Entamoeba invadens IP1]|uniref:Equilibrative nucleoside transporter n=1 Tax=Entamoeba invadens IP1 TaxID=370355 RepID=A0A0A1UG73_ENTIV|nr:hypothetical protein EIN_048200 [Entamoeba invadens IP1]ELP94487.1 hypothetical protein EIN_048200 [Entamoeba invadens IP1]|eukprot:XP_004261258.1 hypothetical protein EIN_048200 [Entamoeba invadens IP1]
MFGNVCLSPFTNGITMVSCFLFGVCYIGLYNSLIHADVGFMVGIFELIDGIGGVTFAIVFVVLSFTPNFPFYYRTLGLVNQVLNLVLSALYVILSCCLRLNSDEKYNESYGLYLLPVAIINCILPATNFVVFFNLSYSLSALHTTCYITGMAFSGVISSFLSLLISQLVTKDSSTGSIENDLSFLTPLIILVISAVTLVLTIINFYGFHDVANFLVSQKIVHTTDYLILNDNEKPTNYPVLRMFWGILTEMKFSLLSLTFIFFTTLSLYPHFLNAVEHLYLKLQSSENEEYFMLISICSLLFAIGDTLGRLLEIFQKIPTQKFVFFCSIGYLLISYFVTLPMYFIVNTLNTDVAVYVEYATFVVAFVLGAIQGFLMACSIEHSSSNVEPRLSVALVCLAIYIGVFSGVIVQISLGYIDTNLIA